MAAQVRGASVCPMVKRASNAVNSGPTAMMISTLATVVKVSASMKAVNITLQHTPLSQKAAEPASTPQWRRSGPCPDSSARRPAARSADRHKGRMSSSDSAVKALRQKVTSKRAADSSWRVTTPAMDHIRVTATIRKTACVCVRRLSRRKGIRRLGWRACARAP